MAIPPSKFLRRSSVSFIMPHGRTLVYHLWWWWSSNDKNEERCCCVLMRGNCFLESVLLLLIYVLSPLPYVLSSQADNSTAAWHGNELVV